MQSKHPILDKDIALLEVSNEFLLMTKQNNFQTLGEILQHPVSELKKKPAMTYRMMAELGQILKKHDLLDQIDED